MEDIACYGDYTNTSFTVVLVIVVVVVSNIINWIIILSLLYMTQ